MNRIVSTFAAFAVTLAGIVAIYHYPVAEAVDPGSNTATAIEADALDSSNQWYMDNWAKIDKVFDRSNGGATVTGYGVLLTANTSSLNGGGNAPLPDGTPVYLRWVDKDGQVLPIYKTRTHRGYAGAPNPSPYAFAIPQWTDNSGTVHTLIMSGAKRPLVRVWIDPYVSPDTGNQVVQMKDAAANVPAFSHYNFGASVTTLAGQYANNYTVFMTELPTSGYMTRPQGEWIETPVGQTGGLGVKQYVSGKVWLEAQGSDLASGPTQLGADRPAASYKVVMSSLTNEGAVEAAKIRQQPVENRALLFKNLLTEHPEYIAETAYTHTNAKGEYLIKFTEGKLDQDNIYGYVEDPEGNPMPAYSTWTIPTYGKPDAFTLAQPLANPLYRPVKKAWENVHFAVIPYVSPVLEITNYDTNTRPAPPGGKALIAVSGNLSKVGTSIVWKNANGDEVKRCDDIASLPQANDCTYDIPSDAQTGDVYRVELQALGNVIAVDSLIVSNIPKVNYEPVAVEAGVNTASSAAPTFDNPATEQVEKGQAPAGTTYRLADNAPKGYTINTDTGVVSWTGDPKEADETVVVPVVAEIVNAVNNKKVDRPAEVTFNFKGKLTAQKVDLKYDDQEATVGTPKDSTPIFTGEGTADVATLPADTVFKLGTLPEGVAAEDVAINTSTGVVTFTGTKAQVGKSYDIPVVATFADKSTENAVAKFTVGDKPDADNDGVSDDADQCVNTPAGAVVDANGCAVAPVLGEVPKVNGTIGVEITPIEVPVTNTGMNEGLTCTAAGLPAGLSVALKADGSACVISGTPTEKVTDKPFTVTLGFTKPDGDKPAGTPVAKEGTATVGDKPVAPNWEDTTGKPGDDVVVPNAGGDVPDGATVESTGPGT
ncbi:hypothetical protein BM477_00005, partial [Boudabousia marimammalium]